MAGRFSRMAGRFSRMGKKVQKALRNNGVNWNDRISNKTIICIDTVRIPNHVGCISNGLVGCISNGR